GSWLPLRVNSTRCCRRETTPRNGKQGSRFDNAVVRGPKGGGRSCEQDWSRAWRACPDAPGLGPHSRYLGPGSHDHGIRYDNFPEAAGRGGRPFSGAWCPSVSMVPGACADNIGGTSYVSPFGRVLFP